MDFLLSVYFWNSSSRHKGEHGLPMPRNMIFSLNKSRGQSKLWRRKSLCFSCNFYADEMMTCMVPKTTNIASFVCWGWWRAWLTNIQYCVVWFDGDQQCMSVSKEISNVGLLLNLCMLMWIMWKTFVRWWAVARFSQLGIGLCLEDCVYIETFYSTFFTNHIYSVW